MKNFLCRYAKNSCCCKPKEPSGLFAQVHADLGALALEVGHQLVEDELLVFFADVGVVLNGLCVDAVLMLSSQLIGLHDLELGTVDLADGALEAFGHSLCFVNITANGANKLLHNNFYA